MNKLLDPSQKELPNFVWVQRFLNMKYWRTFDVRLIRRPKSFVYASHLSSVLQKTICSFLNSIRYSTVNKRPESVAEERTHVHLSIHLYELQKRVLTPNYWCVALIGAEVKTLTNGLRKLQGPDNHLGTQATAFRVLQMRVSRLNCLTGANGLIKRNTLKCVHIMEVAVLQVTPLRFNESPPRTLI